MVINFFQYFQIEAAAKGNVSYLLALDLLLVNESIRRQESAEGSRAVKQSLEVGTAVQPAQKQLASGSEGRSGDETFGHI